MPPTARAALLPVEQIHLDRENPRLPEGLRGADALTILSHLWPHEVLLELAHFTLYFTARSSAIMKKGCFLTLAGSNGGRA